MKKYLLGFAAIVLAIGFSAFTSVRTNQIFVFTGDPMNPSDFTDNTKWVEIQYNPSNSDLVNCEPLAVKEATCSFEVNSSADRRQPGQQYLTSSANITLSGSGPYKVTDVKISGSTIVAELHEADLDEE